jgi:hypothetical protein
MVLGLLDPAPLVRGTDPAPDPSIIYTQAKKARKTLIPTVRDFLMTFLSLKHDVNIASKSNKQKNFEFHGSATLLSTPN